MFIKDFNWNFDKYKNIPIPTKINLQPTIEQAINVKFRCEALRDGLGLVKIIPSIDLSMNYVDLAYKFGIRYMTVGIFSGFNTKADKYIRTLLKKMYESYPDIIPMVLCLTTKKSIDWLIECKQINPNLEALLFMGSAPSRMIAEGWDKNFVLDSMKYAFKRVANEGINIVGATEHTTQTPPDYLKEILKVQVDAGGEALKSFIIADTIGVANPTGMYRLVSWLKKTFKDLQAPQIKIEYHGHDDLDNATANSMAAISAGAEFIHTVPRGYGERAGNTRLEAVALNLYEILDNTKHELPWNFKVLNDLLVAYDHVVKLPTPKNGIMGINSFKTGYGLHGAAMQKLKEKAREARKNHDTKKANQFEEMYQTVYCAVDPEAVGRKYEIVVGPSTGVRGIQLAAELEGYVISQEKAKQIYEVISEFDKPLTRHKFLSYLK